MEVRLGQTLKEGNKSWVFYKEGVFQSRGRKDV